ncbi:MAG TPA: MFS transporter, partial [Thermomicrobiales bacterium]|nr:MFS transporter [Thermomicrobiales bacterium]
MPNVKASASRLLINRNFALLWSGQTLSSLGDTVFETTLVVWIATELAPDKSWKSLAVSGLLVASTIPVLVVGPLAGVFVDRWRDKRRVMVRADLLSALLVLSLLPVTGIVHIPGIEGSLPLAWQLAAIFLVVFVASAVAQFFRPAWSILLRDIVPEPERPRAIGLNQASYSLAFLVGPPLAAPLLLTFGAQWALLINAASFLASLLTLRAMTVPATTEEPETATAGDFVSEFREGLRFFRGSRVHIVVAITIMIVTFGLGALNTLDVFFVTENLGAPAKYFGILGAALGAGMLLGSIAAGVVASRLRLEDMIWGSLALIGLVVLVYARLTSFPTA